MWLTAQPVFSEPAVPCVICPRGRDDLHFVSLVDEEDPCALRRSWSQLHPLLASVQVKRSSSYGQWMSTFRKVWVQRWSPLCRWMLVRTVFHLPLIITGMHPQGHKKGPSCKNKFVCAFLHHLLRLPCQNGHNNPHWCPAGLSSFPTIYFLVFSSFNFPKFLNMGYRHSCGCLLLNFGLKSREFYM